MIYPIKTLSQLPLVLKGFRKERGLTQAAIAEKLGISQQSYAYFEANPATATLGRLYTVLRILDVEIFLNPTSSAAPKGAASSVGDTNKRPTVTKATGKNVGKTPVTVMVGKTRPSAVGKAKRIAVQIKRKENW